ncbi:MAG: hypothetical protein WB699_04925 [Bacteroidota bacterium]
MTTRMVCGCIVMMFVLALPAYAGGTEQFQRYFSDAANKVKATEDPAQKREILNESFQTMLRALDMVETSPMLSKADAVSIHRFRATLQEKQDELVGANGFTRVPDAQLNAFSNYVVQDMEQADQTITISVLTLIVIALVILVLL